MAVRDNAAEAGAGETFASTKDVLKAGGGQVIEDARSMVRNMADQQKHKVASRLGGVAQALHETAKTLEKQNATAGRYAGLAARQVDRATKALKERAVEELVGEAEDFARRQPMLFIGGAMAAGFILSRVIKSGEATPAQAVRPVEATGAEALGGQI